MIRVEGLTKYYGERAAIRDLAFQIETGEVVGFIGLNGAGKSTTLRVLGCVLLPTSGRVTIDGFDIAREPHEIRRRIGFLPDLPPLYGEMTVREYLKFAARLRGVPARDADGAAREAEKKTGLADAGDEMIGGLSHGFRQRVGLAQALVHRPALLVLDEPTSGLDPKQIVEMRALIRALRGEHTVLLSSHNLGEVSQTCDRLLVIQEGAIVAHGTEPELAARMGAAGGIEIEIGAGAPPTLGLEVQARAIEAVRAVDGVRGAEVVREPAGAVILHVDAPSTLRPAVARAVVGAGLDLLRIDRGQSQLESIFLELTRGGPDKEGLPS